MAKKCKMVIINDAPKFPVRRLNRCVRCGRSKGVYRKFGVCRICFRELAHRGMIPGVTKASW